MKARTLLIGTAFVLGVTGARAQWVVTDPGNLAQSIINMSDNIAHTSKTAVNTAESFAETVKIYEQAKKYYDQLKSVNNLIQDARKVRDIILMVGDAPGDRDAARKNGVLFYPILVRHEADSWVQFTQKALPSLLDGSYPHRQAALEQRFADNLGAEK